MNRDNVMLGIVLSLVAITLVINVVRRSQEEAAKRTESAQDASQGEVRHTMAPEATNAVVGIETFLDGQTLLIVGGRLHLEVTPGPVSANNPNDYTVRWTLTNGTWTAHWTKD